MTNNTKQTFIVIEGPDSVGKETVSKELYRRLDRAMLNVGLFSFPDYSSATGKAIRNILNTDRISDEQKECLSYLFAADRLATLPKMDQRIVIADRWFHSNLAYSSGYNFVKDIEVDSLGITVPDITFILTKGFEDTQGKENPDAYEVNSSIQQAAINRYRSLKDGDLSGKYCRITNSDVGQTVDQMIDFIHSNGLPLPTLYPAT